MRKRQESLDGHHQHFDVFLSYASADRHLAKELASGVRRLGLKVWFDQEQIRPGELFINRIEQGLAASNAVVVLLSSSTNTSQWVREEVHVALRMTKERELPIIPVIVGETELPGLLANRQAVRLSRISDHELRQLYWGITGRKRSGTQRSELQMITDGRFIDSALFLWMMSSQPLRHLGWNIKLVQADWRTIPEQVAASENAVAFYNRRSLLRHLGCRLIDVTVWCDLCVYRGYALLGRRRAGYPEQLSLEHAQGYLADLRQECLAQGRKIALNCMGVDSIWVLDTPLLPQFRAADCDIYPCSNADLGLTTFLNGYGDLDIGGLPLATGGSGARLCRDPDVAEQSPTFLCQLSYMFTSCCTASPGTARHRSF